jgi:polyribonucleotide nucleotidyltransferase
MFDVYRKEVQWGGRTLTLETGKMARQADGAVVARYGDTVVLCTVVAAKTPRQGIDFFPLSVHYQEKTYSAGKIPGGFFKREGRPTEKEVLTSRLIDRPIRPLFVKGFKNETQVICTVLAHDLENDPDVVAMVGTSAALCISGVPFLGPIAGCRVGYTNGEYVLNPLMEDAKTSDLDLMVAGTQEGVLMVESMASELTEEVMLGAVTFGHESFQPVIQAIIELAEACAKEPPARPTSKPLMTSRTSPSVRTSWPPQKRRRSPAWKIRPRLMPPRACSRASRATSSVAAS